MKKNPASRSGLFNLRTVTACAFFSVGSLLTYFSLAASAGPVHRVSVNKTSAPAPKTPTSTITVNSTSPVINANDGMCTLPEAIIAANTGMPSGTMAGECPAGGGPTGSTAILLQSFATYTLVNAHNSSYGPNGLPEVTSTITIEGNGSIVERNSNSATNFRLFYISTAGNLALHNVTVRTGSAKGGNGGTGFGTGGGGLGAGGAIYNQGGLTLSAVTLTGNAAQGGNGGIETAGQGSGGGGMGGDGGDTGGGLSAGGGGGGMGGKGGISVNATGGGGGGGLNLTDVGQPGAGPLGGAGGGTTGGNGGNGAPTPTSGMDARGPGGGGGGQGNTGLTTPFTGGKGATGGGGGGCVSNGCVAGNGGFGGGGGGAGSSPAGTGGFGGGGGGANTARNGGTGVAGSGGFGGGTGEFDGGGGGGMGGAIFNDGGTLTVANSTISGNTATGGSNGSGLSFSVGGDGRGGAIFNLNGTVNITFSTLASNTVTGGPIGAGGSGTAGLAVGSGIYNHKAGTGTATMTVQNSILAGTGIATCANDGGGVFTSGGYNVAQTPGATCGFTGAGDVTGVNPMLLALAYNGGPTNTQALQLGSQAIDRIPNGVNGCQAGVSVDQRNSPRAGGPGLGGTACDSGAFEFQSVPTPGLPGPPTFGHPIISGVGGNGFEQDIRLDPTDPLRVYTSSPGALLSDTSWIWHSRDGGRTFKWITAGAPLTGKATLAPCAGGGDTELGVDSAGHLYFNDLTLANFTVARSDDGGVTMPCNNTGVPDTAVDRQWYAIDGDPVNGGGSIYLTNDEIGPGMPVCGSSQGNNVLVMYRSPANGVGATAGLAFGPANKVTANLTCDEGIMGNNEVSPVATTTGKLNPGPTTLPTAVRHVYVIHDNATFDQIQIGRCFPVAFGAPAVNVSDPSGLNCDNLPVASFPGFKTGGNFPTLAIDKAGNLYAVWEQAPIDGSGHITGDTVLKYSFSTNEGTTWSTPMQIDTSGSPVGTLHNNVFAWIAAGDDGRVNIVWYGTTGLSDPNNDAPLPGHGCGQNATNPPPPQMGTNLNGPDSVNGFWSLWMVQSLNGHAASPTFTAPILASEHFVHHGNIQTVLGGQCGDRTLGDFLQMRLGPFGEAQISYADSNSIVEFLPHGMYVRQNGGNGVFAASSPVGIPGLTPFNSVTDPSGDGKYEVGGMTSANMPQLDITGSSVSLLTTAPCSVAAPCYQVVMQLNNLSLAPTTAQDPDPDLVWLTQWFVPSTSDANGGKNFIVYAESLNGAALQCFVGENAAEQVAGGVLLTYPGNTQLNAANCQSTLGANGSITIDVPLSNVNESGAIDNHLHEVTASTMTLQQPANTVPSQGGAGGVLFNLIDVAQGYTFAIQPPVLTSVASVKTHGGAGTFPINLALPPNTSPRAVECRGTGSINNYTLVFTFTNNLISVANAQVTGHDPVSGTGSVVGSPVVSGNQVTVNLTNVSTGQYLTVTLNSVLDVAGGSGDIVSPQLGILVGDVNADGGASNLDVSLVKAKVAAGATVDSTNFRNDVNADGGFSNLDVSITKSQVAAGAVLPSTP